MKLYELMLEEGWIEHDTCESDCSKQWHERESVKRMEQALIAQAYNDYAEQMYVDPAEQEVD